MHLHSVSDDSADSPSLLARSLDKPRQARIRRYLNRIATTFLTLFAHKKNKDTEYDIPLGDQVKLPEEFLETVSRIPESQSRK